MSARIAMDTQKSMSEDPTFEIGADLSLDEPGDGRVLPPRPSQEGFELIADDLVKKRLFGLVAFVSDGGKQSIGTMRRSGLPENASDVPSQQRRGAAGGMDQSHARVRPSSRTSNRSDAENPGSRCR